MRRWLPLLKQITGVLAGLGVISCLTWFGMSEIYRVLTTGELLARYGSKGVRGYTKLISFETSPVDFTLGVGAHLVMAGLGIFFWIMLWRRTRAWWAAKP